MRYSFVFICACAFAVVPLVGCSDTQTKCESAADCNDGDDCTADACDPQSGTCSNALAVDGTRCDFGGLPGVCMSGAFEVTIPG